MQIAPQTLSAPAVLRSSFLVPCILYLLPRLTSAACECGYTVNNTLYTELIESDFLHLTNITNNSDWQAQNYTVTSALARGPYGKNATLGNVVANPLRSQYDWAGEGVEGGDAGLQLFVRGGETQPGALIPMAELATIRDDILYGSFRAGLRATNVSGTCGAFFWVTLLSLPVRLCGACADWKRK